MKGKNVGKVASAAMTVPAYSRKRSKSNTAQRKSVRREIPEKNNLLDNSILGRILKWPRYQQAVHAVTTAVFLLIIYSGLTNGNDQKFVEGSVFATAFVWDIWHPLLAFSILFIGRFWCSVCPMGAIHGWISRNFGSNRKYPEKFRNLWPAIALFIFVTAAERHLFRFTRNPEATAYLLLAFLGIAVVLGLVYEKRSFCRYVCPTGLVLGVFSMISGSELRCRSKDVCTAHKQKECLTGNRHGYGCPMYEFPQTMQRNNNCIYCTECIKTCSEHNIRISSRPFGSDVLRSKKVSLDESFFVHSIIVIMLFLMGMEHTAFRNMIIDLVHFLGVDRNIMAAVILTSISAAAVLFTYLLHRFGSPCNAKKQFVSYSYAFVPLGLAAYMAWNVFKLFRGLFYGMYDVTHRFGLDIMNSHPSLDYGTLNGLQIIILLAGSGFSLWLGCRLADRKTGNSPGGPGLLPMMTVLGIYTVTGLWILTLPVLG